uniref:Large ribosomal subunit protein mL44 n=1 Tax=Clastoptera arizonana TaxID=38151 RepID=A0A1B6DW47_9HEMI
MSLRLGSINYMFLSLNLSKKYILNTSKRDIKRWVAPTLKELKRRKDKMGPEKPNHRNTYIEWNYNSEVYAFGKRLSEEFDEDLLRQALTERSYIIKEELKQQNLGIEEPVISLKDNREFVVAGEVLMNNYIVKYLRTVYPRFPEEGICAVRDFLMSEETLSDISFHIGTSEIILCSDFPVEKLTLSNVLKAIVFALQQSSGEERANNFIRDFIITYLSGKDINELWTLSNPFLVLSNIYNRDGKAPIEPRIIAQAGRNTILAAFQIGIYSNKKLIGVGFGESIEIAKEMAARDSLKRLFKTTIGDKPIPYNLELSLNSRKTLVNLSIQEWCEKNIDKLMKV